MYRYVRSLNNNAVLASRNDGVEVILMGKGIGFSPQPVIQIERVERAYVLSDQGNISSYLELLDHGDPQVFEVSSEIILHASEALGDLHPSIFAVLSGHIDFAIKRLREGQMIDNPLLDEIRILYHQEFPTRLKRSSCSAANWA